ncbi:MAG TPA: RNA polymerase sigma factor [Bryobacteraceae bacterium]|nr:RNA polymerase sigma factor [Bryobacteraceae bacterium]
MRLDSLTDEVLLVRARGGCEPSFTLLYQRHQGRIYRFSLQMSGSESIAEEVTQEVFLALVADLTRYEASRGMLLPYLMGVARHQTYRSLRHEQPFLSLEEGEDSSFEPSVNAHVLEELTGRQTLESLHRAIGSLPPVYREAIILCDLEEMDYAQAAQALGCAIGTVRSRLHRGRALLMEKWQAERPAASLRSK